MSKTPRSQSLIALGTAASLAVLSAGCASINESLSGGKIDYRTSGAQTVKLDVPPDLSQLPGQTRFGQVSTGSVSANSLMQESARRNPATQVSTIAPSESGEVKLVREGQQRWLQVALPPEQVWPKVRDFWLETGFELVREQADAGVMETNFSENRAKVPQDGVRKYLGWVFEMLYDTGERDQYRTRIERTANGTEIYIAHRGLIEEYEDPQRKERTTWRPRPSDPQLEAEMLSRLMVKLGASQQAADAARSQAATAPATAVAGTGGDNIATMLSDGTSLRLAADFDTAWRRVGLALDRGGFTVETRDRSRGVYEVRLARQQDGKEPGFFARLFGRDQPAADALARYQVKVEGQGGRHSQVSVLSESGGATTTPTARKVAQLLLDELN